MLSDWLIQQVRNSPAYKFPVTQVTELAAPGEEVMDYLALALLLAHGNPQQMRDRYHLRLKDAEDNSLNILKKYLEDRIFPSENRIGVRVANFGEVLASRFLIDFENFWFPIYKLRFREKKDWAMRLTDLCLIKRLDGATPQVCYGEVKTVSGRRDKNIAIEGHNSLVLGEVKDYLSDPEILHFVSTILYEARRLEEARFISGIGEGNIKYSKRHDLFIIHSRQKWTDEILDRLECHPLDSRLVDFSVRIVLISQLRQLIDTSYSRSTAVASTLVKLMDKQEYLQNTYISLESLMRNRQFRNDLAQVQARSIQEELLSVQPTINYTFDSGDVWRRCDYIFSNGSLLLREEIIPPEDAEKRKTILDSLKVAAQSFESLSKFATDVDREILLINAAICYHIAGYQMPSRFVCKEEQETNKPREKADAPS